MQVDWLDARIAEQMTSEIPVNRPTPFDVERTSDGDIRVLSIKGELDLATAPELEETLGEAQATSGATVLINLGACEFIDSTGIALIVRSWQRTQEDGGGAFALCCASDQVQRVLEISGVGSSIPVYEDLDSALAALNGSRSA